MRTFSLPAVGPAPFPHCAESPDPLPWCSASPEDTAAVLFQWRAKENVAGEREGAPAVGRLFGFVSNPNPINLWALPVTPRSTEPAHCTYSPLHKAKKWKKPRESNVVQWHLKNAYTKSPDEKYLYSGDDTAQNQTLSSPNTNK